MRGSEVFYQNEVEARKKAITDLEEDVKVSIVAGIFKHSDLNTRFQRHMSKCSVLGDFSKEISKPKNVTDRQFAAATTAKKNCHRFAELIRATIDKVNLDESLGDFLEFSFREDIPKEIQYYLIEAKKCYFFESYDASIVMIARAIEFSLKEHLRVNGAPVPRPAVMSKLIDNYTTYVGKKDVLKYIYEVQKMDRNIAAHDSDVERRRMTKAEADHSWTAIRIILRDLLKIVLKVRVEKEE